jgi:dsRNA-specific ribonuclease
VSTNNDATLQLEALQSLLQHPGWQIYVDQVKRMVAVEMSALRATKVSEEILRHTHRWIALGDTLLVPEVLMKPLVMQLTVTKK